MTSYIYIYIVRTSHITLQQWIYLLYGNTRGSYMNSYQKEIWRYQTDNQKRKSEVRQYHGKTKKTKKTYNNLQNITQKHKPHKNSGELRFSRRLNSSCSTYWYPSCYSCLKSGCKSWVGKRLDWDYDKQNIFVFICDTYIPWPGYVGDY